MSHVLASRRKRRNRYRGYGPVKTNSQIANEKIFGTHLTLDGYGADSSRLGDMHLVFKSLDELPGLLKMKKITTPYVVYHPGNNKKDSGGYSGFVMIAESHISVHTFPKNRFVSIDVYTCREGMDTGFVASYFKRVFDLKAVEKHFIIRGAKYPVDDIYTVK